MIGCAPSEQVPLGQQEAIRTPVSYDTLRPSLVTDLPLLSMSPCWKSASGCQLSLSIGDDVRLLTVGELVHVLVVRKESVRLSAVEVVVPDAEQGEDDGQVVLELCLLEVTVHRMRASEELLEVVETDTEGDRETDGRPERVATADPIPEREHIVRVDAERFDGLRVG